MARNSKKMSWQDFLDDAPARVIEVIKNGPFPLADYDASRLTWADKKRGMMRYKGGEGNVPVKGGQKAIVYFDPQFCEHVNVSIPSHVEARHSHTQVVNEFRKL